MIEKIAVFAVLGMQLELPVKAESETLLRDACKYVAQRLGGTFYFFKTGALAEPEVQSAWLIEAVLPDGRRVYYTGSGWSWHWIHAVRFCRRIDAESMQGLYPPSAFGADQSDITYAEHQWLLSAPDV